MECRAPDRAGTSIPFRSSRAFEGVDMSHEAAVGKLAEEEINYLMSRGVSQEQATSTIVRGFLSVDIKGLPGPLKEEIDRTIDTSNRDTM